MKENILPYNLPKPAELKHNNDDYALIDDSQIRGGLKVAINKTDRNNIPLDKRGYGVVKCIDSFTGNTGDWVVSSYIGTDLTDVNWTNEANWVVVGADLTDIYTELTNINNELDTKSNTGHTHDTYIKSLTSSGATIFYNYEDGTIQSVTVGVEQPIIPPVPDGAENITLTNLNAPYYVTSGTATDVKVTCLTTGTSKNIILPTSGFIEDKSITFYVDNSSTGSVIVGNDIDNSINHTYTTGTTFNVFWSLDDNEYSFTTLQTPEIVDVSDAYVTYKKNTNSAGVTYNGSIMTVSKTNLGISTLTTGNTVAMLGQTDKNQIGIYQIIGVTSTTYTMQKTVSGTKVKKVTQLNSPTILPVYTTYDGTNLTTLSFVEYLNKVTTSGLGLSGLGTPSSPLTFTGRLPDALLAVNDTAAPTSKLYQNMASNDYWTIYGEGLSDVGRMFIETGDNNNEPICFATRSPGLIGTRNTYATFSPTTLTYTGATANFAGYRTPTGTSSQFLKANGTVDNNSYVLNSAFTGHTHSQLYQPNGTNPFVYTDNGGTLHINGNIVQSGSTYETHAEELYTTKDYIYLRDGAVGGLANGEYTGIEAVKYDGVNNGRLVFDNQGVARVGDVGVEQPLATREEIPLNDAYAYWDSAENKFKTRYLTSTDFSVIHVTYNELRNHITGGTLVQNADYLLTDYMTTHELDTSNFGGNPILSSGVIEPLIIRAVSTTSTLETCNSTLHPEDVVYYNPLDNTDGYSKGRINRRIDTIRNVDVPTDWRYVKYRRYLVNTNNIYEWVLGSNYAIGDVCYNGQNRLVVVCVKSHNNSQGTNTENWLETVSVDGFLVSEQGIEISIPELPGSGISIAADINNYIDLTLFQSDISNVIISNNTYDSFDTVFFSTVNNVAISGYFYRCNFYESIFSVNFNYGILKCNFLNISNCQFNNAITSCFIRQASNIISNGTMSSVTANDGFNNNNFNNNISRCFFGKGFANNNINYVDNLTIYDYYSFYDTMGNLDLLGVEIPNISGDYSKIIYKAATKYFVKYDNEFGDTIIIDL